MKQVTQIVTWSLQDPDGIERAQKRIDELNAEGFICAFFQQSSAATNGGFGHRATLIMVKNEADALDMNTRYVQSQVNSQGGSQSIS